MRPITTLQTIRKWMEQDPENTTNWTERVSLKAHPEILKNDYANNYLCEYLPYEQLNEAYQEILQATNWWDQRKILYKMETAKIKLIQKTIFTTIPEDYTLLYPAARQIKRHFVIHSGPTNSGKTYEAIRKMEENQSGIYLAPLRLLAYEQYETMNADGFACSLVTGEERIENPEAVFQASTIEMANYTRHYDCAVIDEAQMISDHFRGGAWTSAVLGLCADEIHICTAPYAVNLLVRLINSCHDTYEIVQHERKTELKFQDAPFHLGKTVEKGDALVVFSRRNVHAVASELQHKGIKCSVIYGALPYEVRHKEAEKFASGETDVVVATDAIGMGMNLPIRRVVFLETAKYDGKNERPLKAEEVQQIAGRAGRYGMYDCGVVNSDNSRKRIRKAIDAQIPDIEKAVIAFPEALLNIPESVTAILRAWDKTVPSEGFVKPDVQSMIHLSSALDPYTDNKRLIYKLITVPFDVKNMRLYELWLTLSKHVIEGENLHLKKRIPSVIEHGSAEDLDGLEQGYRRCDMLYTFAYKFGYEEDIPAIVVTKRKISDAIFRILQKQKLKSRTCKYCGKTLPWNYPYGMCEACYEKMYSRRNYWYEDDYDAGYYW